MRNRKKGKTIRRASSIIYACLIYIFLYLPIIVVVVFSFNTSKLNLKFEGFTFEWYWKMFDNKPLIDSFKNSIIVAVASTLISVVVGTIASVGMYRYSFRGKGIIDSMLYIPIVIPEIILGISLLMLFTAFNITLGMLTLIIAHVSFSLPFVIVTVRSRMAGFDRSIEEAAMDLGASPIRTFTRITLPIIAPGVIAGAMLALTLSLDDVIVSFFTTGIKSKTFPIQIQGMVRTGVSPDVYALSTLMIVGTIIIMVLVNVFDRVADKKMYGEEKTIEEERVPFV
ncbi:MAG: ABC transporter permease [Clostridiales bacterium]|nr:ABC transporter permease [Clostridiales bacterium]